MPRENQKRGKRAKKRQQETSKAPAPRAPSPAPVELASTSRQKQDTEWPLLDAETRAYFVQIDRRIVELEELGVGQSKRARDRLDEDDERVLIIRGSLASLVGHEIELATDPETSFVLERLLYSMDDFARRVLADRFVGQYAQLARNRFACHVLQTLFFLGSFTVERECRGSTAGRPMFESEELRTMTELLSIACAELIPDVSQHIYDSHSTHLLRSAVLLLTGSPFPDETERDTIRSKKSRTYVGKQAPLRALLPSANETSKGKERERQVPAQFLAVWVELLDAIDAALGKGTGGSATRVAGTDPGASVLVQMLVAIEADQGRSLEAGSMMDRLLENSMASMSRGETISKRSDYLETVMRDATSSHLLEIILMRCPQAVFDTLWSTYFTSRLEKLAVHPVSNFIVAKGIARLDSPSLEAVAAELIASDAPKLMIEHSRTGALKALTERAAEIHQAEPAVSRLLQKSLAMESQTDSKPLVLALLVLTPCSLLTKAGVIDYLSPPEPTLQGSLLAQGWLQMSANEPLVDSILSIPVEYLVTLCCNGYASRMLDVLLDSPAIKGRYKRRFVMRLLGQYHFLVDHRIGSRVVDRCWDYADVYLKEKVAQSLLPYLIPLSGSKIAHFFVRRIQLPLYERKPQEWKSKMTAALQTSTFSSVSNVNKRGSSDPDDIDTIFASKKKRYL